MALAVPRLQVLQADNATDSTTGSIVTPGGIGVGSDGYLGGDLTVTGSVFANTISERTASTGVKIKDLSNNTLLSIENFGSGNFITTYSRNSGSNPIITVADGAGANIALDFQSKGTANFGFDNPIELGQQARFTLPDTGYITSIVDSTNQPTLVKMLELNSTGSSAKNNIKITNANTAGSPIISVTSSDASLGGLIFKDTNGNELIDMKTVASATVYAEISNNAGDNGGVIITARTSDATDPGFSFRDKNNANLLRLTTVPSAVNGVIIESATTGNPAVITSSQNNVNLRIIAPGTGDVEIPTLDITSSLTLPTSGGTQSNLNYYEEGTFSVTWGDAVPDTASTVYFTRIGNVVTLMILNLIFIGDNSSFAIQTNGTPVPTRLRPSSGGSFRTFPMVIQRNFIQELGYVQISSTISVRSISNAFDSGLQHAFPFGNNVFTYLI